MSCIFFVAGDIEKARQAVESNGGTFVGDYGYGTFSGSGIQGEYRKLMGGDSYVVTITKKPWLVSCGYIEGKIKEYFK